MDVDDLYGLPLERFTPERNALARELRRAGRREEASEVAALRKPSVAAWAVNQLVRTQRRAVDELFAAGDALREAHDQVLAGRGDAGSLRSALAQERGAVEALSSAAGGLLSTDGHELSPTIIERVAESLHAAALDDDARREVGEGRLERELRHVGLGVAAPASGAAASPASRRAGKPRPARPKQPSQAERAAAEERAKARAQARAAERDAQRRVERTTRAVQGAQERRDKAAQALEEAEQALAGAEREHADAEAQLGAAERAMRELG